MHLTLYTTTTAVCDTDPLTDTLGDTPTEVPHTITTKTHPQTNTHHAKAILTRTPQTLAGLAQGTLLILPADHIH